MRFVLIPIGVTALVAEAVVTRGMLRTGPDGGVAAGQYVAAAI